MEAAILPLFCGRKVRKVEHRTLKRTMGWDYLNLNHTIYRKEVFTTEAGGHGVKIEGGIGAGVRLRGKLGIGRYLYLIVKL